jgi:hypothetical protein
MAVQALMEALKRKPGWLEDPRQSFFGALDLWFYLAISDDKTCWTCEMLNQGIYKGIDLRTLFPYLEIISANQMLPYVHPNCRCTLLRVTDIYDYLDATEPSSDELNIF